MPLYSYTAVNQKGQSVKGKITAQNELDLEEKLRDVSLDIVQYKVLKKRGSGFLGAIKTKDLIMFCVHMEQLERAGVPLLDSLADLRDSSDKPLFRDLMAEVYENVKGGDLLSEALKKRGDVFSDVFVGLVAAGERTGDLSEAFHHLAEHLKWSNDLRRKIKKAITYPIALLILMMGVISLMMLFVVPQLSDFLTSQGFELPFYTHALIWLSDFFVNYWYLVFSAPIISIIVLIVMHRTSEKAEYQIDNVMLRLPFIGAVILKINLARFCHFFAITFNSGIGVLECLHTSQKVVSNKVLKEAVTSIIQHVSEGSTITQAISTSQKFPSLVIRMFKVGEDSGDMESALNNVNFFYSREVNDSVDRMVGMIQPTLTIVMGAMMFWVTAAVFGPLYDSFSKMQF